MDTRICATKTAEGRGFDLDCWGDPFLRKDNGILLPVKAFPHGAFGIVILEFGEATQCDSSDLNKRDLLLLSMVPNGSDQVCLSLN